MRQDLVGHRLRSFESLCVLPEECVTETYEREEKVVDPSHRRNTLATISI